MMWYNVHQIFLLFGRKGWRGHGEGGFIGGYGVGGLVSR